MSVDQLSELVDSAKTEAAKMIEQIIHDKRALPTSRIYKTVAKDFKASLNGHSASYTSIVEAKPSFEEIIEDIMDMTLLKNGVLNSVARSLINETSLPKQHDNPVGQTEFWLESFFRKILQNECEALYYKRKSKPTANYVSNLMMELNCLLPESEFVLKESGVFISSDDAILQDFSFRKIIAKDLEQHDSPFSFPFRNIPDGVITFKSKISNVDGWDHAHNVLDLFRLFRLGSVSYITFRQNSSSLIWTSGSGTQSPLSHPSRRFKYELANKDVVDFHRFCEAFLPILKKQNENEKDMFGFKIALERYRNSTLDAVDDGRNLLTAVIGLEALYTAKHEVGEIKYRLSNRIAKLLSYFDWDVRRVRKLIEDAYGYRNTIGHGSNIDQKDLNKVRGILEDVCNVLRVSVVVFGAFLLELNKNQIVFGIDDLMLGTENKEFQERITKIQKLIPPSVLASGFKS